jgi:hypothetical protein
LAGAPVVLSSAAAEPARDHLVFISGYQAG